MRVPLSCSKMLRSFRAIPVRFGDNLLVMARVFAETALNLVGFLNVKAIFSGCHSPRKQVAFQAYAIHLAQFYQTVISELLQSPEKIQVTFVILLHPHFPLRAAFELKEFAQSKLHLPAEDIKFHWQVLWARFDLVFCSDVYAKFPIRKTKTCLLTHGSGLTQRVFDKRALRKSVADFDLILVSGNYDCKLVRDFVSPKTASSRVYPVGVPILDVLKHACIPKEAYFRRIRLDPSQRTVLFAPHWETLAGIDGDDNNYCDDVVSVLKTLDVNILIKLHACSLNPMMGGTIDWRAKLQRLSGDASVRVDEDVDDLPALKHADVLITDISSRAFNFMLLGKPVILYCPIPLVLDEISHRRMTCMRQGAFVAKTLSNLRLILEHVNNQGATKSSAVDVSRECFSNFGNATGVTVDLIKRELNCKECRCVSEL